MTADPPLNSVLIVEDEPKLARLLSEYLCDAGYATQSVDNGNEVIAEFKRFTPTIVLLDLMLPGRDGIQVCRDLRAISEVPIMMITARVEEVDRLLGLDVGADDYICKPFSPREVVARVKAILRRSSPKAAGPEDSVFTIEDDKMQISYRGNVLDLTVSEYDILFALTRSPGRVYSRNTLLDLLRKDDGNFSDRAIDSHIKNLRRKLAPYEQGAISIRSVYGVGYKLEY